MLLLPIFLLISMTTELTHVSFSAQLNSLVLLVLRMLSILFVKASFTFTLQSRVDILQYVASTHLILLLPLSVVVMYSRLLKVGNIISVDIKGNHISLIMVTQILVTAPSLATIKCARLKTLQSMVSLWLGIAILILLFYLIFPLDILLLMLSIPKPLLLSIILLLSSLAMLPPSMQPLFIKKTILIFWRKHLFLSHLVYVNIPSRN